MSHLTLEQRRSIIALRETGKSISFIAKRYGISRKTVYRWMERFNKDGNLNRLPKPGRNRATTAAQDAEMLTAVVSQRDVDARELSLRYNVSIKTVRRRLHANKNRKKIQSFKELMTSEAVNLSEIEPFSMIKEEDHSTVDDNVTDSPERLIDIKVKAEKNQDFQQGVCRCCLSQDCVESIEGELTVGEHSRSYVDIIKNTLGVNLARVRGVSHICSACVDQLLLVLAFQKQIIESERILLTHDSIELLADGNVDCAVNNLPAYDRLKLEVVEANHTSSETENDIHDAVQTEKESMSSDDDAPLNTIPLAQPKYPQPSHPRCSATETYTALPLDAPMIRLSQCAICKEQFKTAAVKLHHVETVHGSRCKICGRRFVKIQEHIDEHEASRVKCDICEMSFYQQSELMRHKRKIHNVQKTAPCPHCDYVGFDYQCLKSHLVCHSKEKNYKCKHCNKKFARRNGLTEHERLHTGVKPLVCELCGEAFTQYTSLRYHKQKHHVKKQ